MLRMDVSAGRVLLLTAAAAEVTSSLHAAHLHAAYLRFPPLDNDQK
jgi:hypothetical protein